jgi:2-polyprenyl-6-methoxyphenol hydroxylase-like FAD-dependent oxidoreductase
MERALVIGGGLAGLLCARVLADLFTHVLLVDADALPSQPENRRAIPQGHHSHVLLASGRKLFEQLFPGLDAELEKTGAPLVDWTQDCVIFSSAGQVPRFPSVLVTRACTRAQLEWSVRQRVQKIANVEIRPQTKVEALVAQGSKVTGAKLEDGSSLSADFIVDASGRHSNAPKWLEALGYASPTQTVVDSFLGYATRLYERPADAPTDFKGILINTRPPENPRAGALWPIEGNRWLITLAGSNRAYPPTDESGFRQFAASMQSPLLVDVIDRARPLTPIQGYRRNENQWRHYESLRRRPERFVVLGDGVCAFNPVYGQGMSVAAMQAQLLGRIVKSSAGLDGVAQAFHRKLPALISPAWMVATGEDARWPSTTGMRVGLVTRFSHWYLGHLMALTPGSPRMVRAFLKVVHMVAGPASLFLPQILFPVLARALNPFRAKPR